MKTYVVFNWKTINLLDWSFKPVGLDLDKAEIYDNFRFAKNEIESRGEPFCKVINVNDLASELQKSKNYNDLGGVSLYSLKYGQKYRVLQKGWEGKIFINKPQGHESRNDRIYLYKEGGGKINISATIAHVLRVEIIN